MVQKESSGAELLATHTWRRQVGQPLQGDSRPSPAPEHSRQGTCLPLDPSCQLPQPQTQGCITHLPESRPRRSKRFAFQRLRGSPIREAKLMVNSKTVSHVSCVRLLEQTLYSSHPSEHIPSLPINTCLHKSRDSSLLLFRDCSVWVCDRGGFPATG